MPDDLPSNSTPNPTPVTAEVVTTPASSGLTPNVAAGLATIFTLVSGIIFLVIEKRDKFVRFWAMQSVFFGVAWFVFLVVSAVISIILASIFAPLFWIWRIVSSLIGLGFLIVWIITMVQAFSGKEWEIPAIGKLAREQLAKSPTLP